MSRRRRKTIQLIAALLSLDTMARAATDITAQISADSGTDNIALSGAAYSVTTTPASALDYSGILSGTGTLEVSGGGTLDLQAISTYTLPAPAETVSAPYISNPSYYSYEGYTATGFIGYLYTLHNGSSGQPDPPAVTIDVGTTLQFGYNSDLKYGNSNSTSVVGGIINTAGGNINIDNILDNGLLDIQGNNSNAIVPGDVSGAGSLELQTGLLYMYGPSTLSGAIICENNMSFYLGTDHTTASIPNAKVVFNNGSFILQTPYTTTETVSQNIYENHYGNDININGNTGPIILSGVYSYSDAGTTIAQQGNPSLSSAALNFQNENGSANRRGINLEGGILQLGNGSSSSFFMPGNNFTTYFNLHKGGLLALDYSNAAPTYVNVTIAGGGINSPYNAAGLGTVILHQGQIVVTTQQYYDGPTQIDSAATLQLGDGTSGDTTLSGSTFVTQTSAGDGNLLQNGQTITLSSDYGFGNGSSTSTGTSPCVVIDNGALVVNNVGSTPLSYISGSGKLTHAGAGVTTLGPGIAYTGATLVAGGTLALGSGASLADSSGITISSAGRSSLIAPPYSSTNTNFASVSAPALDISQAGNQTFKNLSGDNSGSLYLGGNALTVGSSTSTAFGGVILDGGIGGGTGGALIKQGTGALTLSNANMYTGGTTITAGTLAIGNSSGSATGSGSVVVESGAALTGAGTIAGALESQSGSTIEPGSAAGPTLKVAGGADIESGTTLVYTLASPNQAGGAGGNDLLSLADGLEVGTGLEWKLLSAVGPGSGRYVLVDFTGTLQDPQGFAGWSFSGLPAGDSYAFLLGNDGASSAVEVQVSAVPEPSAGLVIIGPFLLNRRRSKRAIATNPTL